MPLLREKPRRCRQPDGARAVLGRAHRGRKWRKVCAQPNQITNALPETTSGRSNRGTLWGEPQFDDSPPDHRRVHTVLGAQFGKNVSSLPLHRLFAHGELLGDFLIRIPLSNQLQHSDFRRCRGIVRSMLGNFVAGFGGDRFFSVWTARVVSSSRDVRRSSAGNPGPRFDRAHHLILRCSVR